MKWRFPAFLLQIQKGTWEWLITYRDVKYAIVQKTVKMHKTVVLTSTLKI